jgi:SAM-dependent methyltransferase
MKMMEAVSITGLDAIINNPEWLEALNTWYWTCGRPCRIAETPLGLSSASFADLQRHLLQTGWFVQCDGKLIPNRAGKDLLVRVNELLRAISRADKEDLVVAHILRNLPLGAAVDIGCGPGHSVLRLIELGFEPVHGYDLAPVATSVARALLVPHQTAYIHTEDATSLSRIGDGEIALIYSRVAFHYFDQKGLASTFDRVLRPGGYVLAELVGLRYYLQKKHLTGLLHGSWRRFLSYWRTVVRTSLYAALGIQLKLAGLAPEIGYTRRSIRRLARQSGLDLLSIGPAPSSVGYLVLMRKPE